MHNREKHPEIWRAKERAEAETVELKAARLVSLGKIQELSDVIKNANLEKEVIAKEMEETTAQLRGLAMQISSFARAMGAIVSKE